MADETEETKVDAKVDTKVDTKTETKVDQRSTVTQDVDIEAAPPSDWPEDWRTKMASGDEKFLKTLERFKSAPEVAKAYRDATRKLSQRPVVEPFPEKGTDEEKAAWRETQGLPKVPDEYLTDLTLDDGMVIGDPDKPLVNEVLAAAHAANASPKAVQSMLKAYYKGVAEQQRARVNQDRADQDTFRDAFRDEYGKEANRYFMAAKGLIETAPEPVRNLITEARLPNGRLLGSDPDVIKWFISLSEEVNPAATVVPTGITPNAKGVKDRLGELEKLMGNQHSEYWKGPKAEALQDEYRKLTEAAEKMEKRK